MVVIIFNKAGFIIKNGIRLKTQDLSCKLQAASKGKSEGAGFLLKACPREGGGLRECYFIGLNMVMLKTEQLKHLDLVQFFAVVLLICIGLAAIYSATFESEGSLPDLYLKQLYMAIAGLIALIIMVMVPPKVFYALAYITYAIAIILLILVLLINRGSEPARWITIGSFNLQPSEAAKFALIFSLARIISDCKKSLQHFTTTGLCLILTAIPMGLVIVEPDLGTSAVFGFLALPMMFAGGISILHLLLIAMPFVVLASSLTIYALVPVILLFMVVMIRIQLKPIFIIAALILNIGIGISGPKAWNNLHPYQQRRIKTFMNPEADPHGAGYQIIQSKIAVGSGGISGKGYLQGTQSHLKFLPAGHTDFIFSVYSEEFGFFGAGTVVLGFVLIVYRALKNASRCRSKFSALILVGGAAHFASHALVNIGMTIGVLPVTGLPLPFISYGGSSLILNMSLAGVMIGTSMRWKEY